MQHCTNSVINTSIGAVPGARVVVTNLDGSAASIFSDNGVTAISGNAVFADAYGNFGFYAANGRYTVTVSGTGIDTMIVLDVLLYDPQDDLEYAAALVGEAAASASAAATSAGAATTANTSAQTAAATASAGAGTASTAATLAQSWASQMGTMVGGIDYSAKYYAQQAAASAAIATAGQVQADWNVTDAGSNAFIKDKPILATVATSGAYADLSGKPTIPTNTNQLTNGSGYITAATAPVTSVNSKAGGSVTLTTDDVQEFGTPTNLWFTAARVRNTILTGLSLASAAAAAATDSVLIAIGKLQAQFNALLSAKDASGGYVGKTGHAHNFWNTAGTFMSSLVNANTAARTVTFPDKSFTVAGTDDVAASGAIKLLGTYTVGTAVASIDFLTIFNSTYDNYLITLTGMQPNGGSDLRLTPAIGGAAETVSNCTAMGADGASVSAGAAAFFTLASAQPFTDTSAASLTCEFRNVNSATKAKNLGAHGTAGTTAIAREGRYLNLTSVVTGFQLTYSAGNFTAGTVRVFGIKNS